MADGTPMVDIILRGQPLLILIISAVFGVVGYAFRQHVLALVTRHQADSASRASVDSLRERVDSQGGRITSIEAALRHLPSAEQVQGLSVILSDLRGEVRAVNEGLAGLGRSLSGATVRIERIESHLLERAR